jgi:hypothetical protein
MISLFSPNPKRKRDLSIQKEEYSLQVYDLNDSDDWEFLLQLNGGESAQSLTSAPGKFHRNYMCCLVLNNNDEERAKKTDKQQPLLQTIENYCSDKPWWPYAARIAIMVPVAVQSGIGLAQGIKRLYTTCPCNHLRGLGMILLSNVARQFAIEYLFMSPIGEFARHVRSELSAKSIPFGSLGDRSLYWAVTNNNKRRMDAQRWLTIQNGFLHFQSRDNHNESEVYYLKISPQDASSSLRTRTLLLNTAYYVPRDEPDYEPPPLVDCFETHDFLWYLAGDGVLVIHGPALADSF